MNGEKANMKLEERILIEIRLKEENIKRNKKMFELHNVKC